jgi:hypothetical protein
VTGLRFRRFMGIYASDGVGTFAIRLPLKVPVSSVHEPLQTCVQRCYYALLRREWSCVRPAQREDVVVRQTSRRRIAIRTAVLRNPLLLS